MPTTKNTRANRGANRRDFAARLAPHQGKPDRRCWIAPDREPAPVTLPPVTMTALTDEDIGLTPDDAAQARAESYIRAVIGHHQKQAEKARDAARRRMMPWPTVHVEVEDDALTLVDPTDKLSSDDAMILADLRRLAGKPSPSWLSPKAAVPLAS